MEKKLLPSLSQWFIKFSKYLKTKKNILQTHLQKTTIDNSISLLITGSFSTKDKTYNSQVNSTSFSCSVSGLICLDDVSLTSTTIISDKNVSNTITITSVSKSLIGTETENYSLTRILSTNTNIATSITFSFTVGIKTIKSKTNTMVSLAIHTTSSDKNVSSHITVILNDIDIFKA